jgi:hypothetical protein
MSPFCQRSGHISDINLTETHREVDHLLLPSTELVPILVDAGASSFSRLEMIAFAHVFDLCLLFEFLT